MRVSTDGIMNLPKPSELKDFLRNEENSVAREFILMNRLVHDLTTAAAAAGYPLLVYTSRVDNDGFDIILDDRDTVRRVQVKSKMKSGSAAKWKIRKSMLRPSRDYVGDFGFSPDPGGEGVMGGVILMEVAPHESTIDITYRYTDLRVIMAFAMGVVRPIQPHTLEAVLKLRKALEGPGRERIEVKTGAFLKAKGPEHLLSLAGLHSRFGGNWDWWLTLLARGEYLGESLQPELPAPREQLIESIWQELSLLSDTPLRRGGEAR